MFAQDDVLRTYKAFIKAKEDFIISKQQFIKNQEKYINKHRFQ